MAAAGTLKILKFGKESGYDEFTANIITIEFTVLANSDRPDRVSLVVAGRIPIGIAERLAAPNGIVETHLTVCRILPHAEPPDAPPEIRDIPTGRVLCVVAAWTVCIAGYRSGIEWNGDQRCFQADLGIEEFCPSVYAMIVVAQIGTIGDTQAMDHTCLKIGDVKLIAPFVIGDVAERGPRVHTAIERDIGEDLRLVARISIELIDRARPSAWAPHAGHPVSCVGAQVKPESRSCGEIDVGRIGAIERNTEHLAHLTGGHGMALRLVDPMLALWGLCRIADVDDAADSTTRVDDGLAAARRGSGKARRIGLARLQQSLLSKDAGDRQQAHQQRKRQSARETYYTEGS